MIWLAAMAPLMAEALTDPIWLAVIEPVTALAFTDPIWLATRVPVTPTAGTTLAAGAVNVVVVGL